MMLTCDLNSLLMADDLETKVNSFEVGLKARVVEQAVDDEFNEAYFDQQAQTIGAKEVFDKMKEISKLLEDK
jgi:hypothetical protein